MALATVLKYCGARIRLLPLLMLVGVVALTLQLVALGEGVMSAQAQASEEKAKAASAGHNKDAENHKPSAAATPQGSEALAVDKTGMGDDPAMMSRSEIDLLKDLSKRRQTLDKRESELAMRERLLEATEKRVEDRIDALKKLEGEVQSLLVDYKTQENDRIESIVGVYERMKPKDAARIMEKLDMGIQLAVAQRMKQMKMAPIMAEMSSDSAKALTTKLAESKALPSLEKQ